jgi:ketopantoate reductase
MKQQGREVPDTLVNPDKYGDIDADTVKLLRENSSKLSDKLSLTSNELAAPPTDSAAIDIAIETNIDLEIVEKAAQQCQTLETLVMWAEEYQRQKATQEEEELAKSIQESVKRRLDLERLTKAQKDLQERLVVALSTPKANRPSIAEIEKLLGIETPEAVKQIAKTSYTEEVPDFLETAKSLLKL